MDTRPHAKPVPCALLSVAQTCQRLGISRATLYARLADGTLQRFGLREANRYSARRFFEATSVDACAWTRTVTR